jgi:hypothetical protein
MPDDRERQQVQVLSARAVRAAAPRPSPWVALALLALVAVFAAGVLSRVPDPEPEVAPAAVQAVSRLRDAIDSGSEDRVREVLADDAILTWPAGPPWGGPLSWSVELVTDSDGLALSQHVAALDDFLAFHDALNARTSLTRCRLPDADVLEPSLLFDTWVVCSFSLQSDLITALAPDDAAPVGQIRFRVEADKVAAVLVDSWNVTFPPFEYLRWIRAERPETYAGVFAGRYTQPKYGADTAAELLEIAAQFAAERGGVG